MYIYISIYIKICVYRFDQNKYLIIKMDFSHHTHNPSSSPSPSYNHGHSNININIYLEIFREVNGNYNLLRIILFELLNYYIAVQNYYIQYLSFKAYMKEKYKYLYHLSQNHISIYTIHKKLKKDRIDLQLPENTFLVIGLTNFYKYKGIKYILKEILSYDEKVYKFLLYLENHIVKLINGMNKFKQFYNYYLNIFFNYPRNNDNINSLLIKRFNELKQNHILRVAKYLDN